MLLLHCLLLRGSFQCFLLLTDALVQIRYAHPDLLLDSADHFFLRIRKLKEVLMSNPISETKHSQKSLPPTCGRSTAPYRKPGGYIPEMDNPPVFPPEQSTASTPHCITL